MFLLRRGNQKTGAGRNGAAIYPAGVNGRVACHRHCACANGVSRRFIVALCLDSRDDIVAESGFLFIRVCYHTAAERNKHDNQCFDMVRGSRGTSDGIGTVLEST